jgi:hypothetical protein
MRDDEPLEKQRHLDEFGGTSGTNPEKFTGNWISGLDPAG